MTIRRPPLPPQILRSRQNVSMIAGTVDGRVASAAAVRTNSRLRAFGRAQASGAPVITAVSFKWDREVLTAAGPQDFVLSYTPITDSLHAYLNGVGLDEGVDYTLSGHTVSLLTAADVLSGDVLWARYAYLAALPNPALADPTVLQSFRLAGNTGTTENFPNPTTPGSWVVLLGGNGVDAVSGLGATWTREVHSLHPDTTPYDIWVGRNTTTGGTAVTWTAGHNNVVTCYEVFATDVITTGTSYGLDHTAPTTGIVHAPGPNYLALGGWTAGSYYDSNGGWTTTADAPSAWNALPRTGDQFGNTQGHPAYLVSTAAGDMSHGTSDDSAGYVGAAILLKRT